jgi:hypothetical protein
MSDYNLVSTGGATWLTPDELTAALADAFPDTEIKHDLVPGAPVTVWAYVPDGEHRTAEIALDETGRMLTFTDPSPDLAARIAVLLARRHPVPDGALQLWLWAPDPIPVTHDTDVTDLLAQAAHH